MNVKVLSKYKVKGYIKKRALLACPYHTLPMDYVTYTVVPADEYVRIFEATLNGITDTPSFTGMNLDDGRALITCVCHMVQR